MAEKPRRRLGGHQVKVRVPRLVSIFRVALHSTKQSRVGQHVAIRIATERSATTRLKDGLSLSRVGQHVAIGTATEPRATTRPPSAEITIPAHPPGSSRWQRAALLGRDGGRRANRPLFEPGGSARCY